MFCDIYLYTLCYYICCLLGACMRCTWLCSLKPGVTPAMICAMNRVTRLCEACQKFSPRSGNPSQFTKLIAHTWPLQRWGLNIVGPLPTTQGNLKFTFVAVEYFTKWIEARAVSTITSKTA
jgi:hypothetical protein